MAANLTNMTGLSTEPQTVVRSTSRTSSTSLSKEKVPDPETQVAKDVSSDSAYLADDADDRPSFLDSAYRKHRPFFLAALALVILGWWVSSIVLKATRHRW